MVIDKLNDIRNKDRFAYRLMEVSEMEELVANDKFSDEIFNDQSKSCFKIAVSESLKHKLQYGDTINDCFKWLPGDRESNYLDWNASKLAIGRFSKSIDKNSGQISYQFVERVPKKALRKITFDLIQNDYFNSDCLYHYYRDNEATTKAEKQEIDDLFTNSRNKIVEEALKRQKTTPKTGAGGNVGGRQ